MIFYAFIKNIEGVSRKTAKSRKSPNKKRPESCCKLQNQESHPIFDGLKQNFVIDSII